MVEDELIPELLAVLSAIPPSDKIHDHHAMRAFLAVSIRAEFSMRRVRLRALEFPAKAKAAAELDFDERLFQFAEARDLELVGDWRARAMKAAALEHPQIATPSQKPGRPRKATRFAPTTALPDKELIHEVESIRAMLASKSKPSSQKAAIHHLLVQDDPHANNQSSTYIAKFKAVEKSISAARRRLGQSLKSGRIPEKKNAAKLAALF